MTDNYNTITLNIEGGLAILTLNRPKKLNSFNDEMFAELRQAFTQISLENGARCLLITGAGRGFCAGQDLSDPAVLNPTAPDKEGGNSQGGPDLGHAVENKYNPLVRAIAELEMPVICAVNGVAAGAGSSVALGCDIVFAARSASFIQSFCKIGVIPDSGGTWHLPRLVGRSRALGMALLGEKLSAQTAEEWGLIWKCIDDDQLMDEAIRTGKHLAKQPTTGLSLIKRAIRESASHSLDEQLDLERDLMRMAGRTEDYAEGVAAFMEKRKPTFIGK